MNTEAAFITAICSAPGDDTARLVFADWLDERSGPGDANRAELIRLGIQRSKVESWDGRVELSEMLARGNELVRAEIDRAPWFAGGAFKVDHGDTATDLGGRRLVFERGFISQVECGIADWLQAADTVCWFPAQKAECGRCFEFAGRRVIKNPNKRRGSSAIVICPHCSGSGFVPRDCPITAQPLALVTLMNLPTANVNNFNLLRAWQKPLEWGKDLRDSICAEWPCIAFKFPDESRPRRPWAALGRAERFDDINELLKLLQEARPSNKPRE